MDIICYAGGTCGDIVASVIDSTDSQLEGSRIQTSMTRSKLKSWLHGMSEAELLGYIESMKLCYLSIPSHRIDFHLKHKHDYITTYADSYELAHWCATRFKNLHPPVVWQKLMNGGTVEDYANIILNTSSHMAEHTDKVISLRDILDGNLLDSLSKYIKTPLNQDLYFSWLAKQRF